MKTTAKVLQHAVRILFVALLILGILFWTGHGQTLVSVHVLLGMAFVFCLWVLAIVALMKRVAVLMAIVGLLWGILIGGLGMDQVNLVPGNLHWLIQTAHLAAGIVGIGFSERLAAALVQSAPHERAA
jgi:hypothetical protein